MEIRVRALVLAATAAVVIAVAAVAGSPAPAPAGDQTPGGVSLDEIFGKAGGVGDKVQPLEKLDLAERLSVEGRSDVPCPGEGECGP